MLSKKNMHQSNLATNFCTKFFHTSENVEEEIQLELEDFDARRSLLSVQVVYETMEGDEVAVI